MWLINLWSWLFSSNVANELGNILSIFSSVHDKLNTFVDKTETAIRDKETQVAQHYADLNIAKTAKDSIAKLLGN